MIGLRFPARLPDFTLAIGVLAALLASGCQRKKPIVIATKPGASQILLGEIVAQHLEARLPGIKIERRPGTGGTAILYQAIAGGDITIYPETTGVIATSILKEQPSSDPAVLLERARLEMARIAQLELIELGFEDPPAVVIPANPKGGETTLSAAADGPPRWNLGMTPDFEQSADFQALNSYHLALAAPMRTLEPADVFDALTRGEVNMVVTTLSDGHLAGPDWRVLQDDKKAFPSQQVCLLARQDRMNAEPGLRPALKELYGRLTPDILRKLNQQIEVAHADETTVAHQFLASIGLR